MRAITLPAGAIKLSDNAKWINRFEFESDSSGNRYIIAQNRAKRFWGCTCRRWTIKRECKHLRMFDLPARELPYELDMILERQPVTELEDSETLSPFAPQVPLSEDPEVQRLLNRINQRTAKLQKQKPTAKPDKPGRRFSLDEDV